jgi:hypothetical protein
LRRRRPLFLAFLAWLWWGVLDAINRPELVADTAQHVCVPARRVAESECAKPADSVS